MSAPLDLVHMVLGLLSTSRVWEGDPLGQFISRLVHTVPEHDVMNLPSALVSAARVAARSEEREALELALDAIVELDLYEAGDELRSLVRDFPTLAVVTRAAKLAGHVGISSDLSDVLALAAPTLPPTPNVQSLIRLQLSPDTTRPESFPRDAWHAAVGTRWPGQVPLTEPGAPLVLLDDRVGTTRQRLMLLAELRSTGWVAKRLPVNPRRPELLRESSAKWAPVIASASDSPNEWWQRIPHGRILRVDEDSLPPGRIRSLLDRLPREVPPTRRPQRRTGVEPAALHPPLDAEVFFDGAFTGKEVGFLVGVSASTVYQHARSEPLLAPRSVGAESYWGFPQLVGLRVWWFLSKSLSRRYSPSVASDFVRAAQSEQEIPVAVRSDGEILFHVEDGIYEGRTGQTTSDVFLLGHDVFRRFTIGAGQSAPDLETPSVHTFVNPAIQRGTPVLKGSRIPAVSVRHIFQRAMSSGLSAKDALEHVRDQYGNDITSEQVVDADMLASQFT